jgi:hypothetical protein
MLCVHDVAGAITLLRMVMRSKDDGFEMVVFYVYITRLIIGPLQIYLDRTLNYSSGRGLNNSTFARAHPTVTPRPTIEK